MEESSEQTDAAESRPASERLGVSERIGTAVAVIELFSLLARGVCWIWKQLVPAQSSLTATFANNTEHRFAYFGEYIAEGHKVGAEVELAPGEAVKLSFTKSVGGIAAIVAFERADLRGQFVACIFRKPKFAFGPHFYGVRIAEGKAPELNHEYFKQWIQSVYEIATAGKGKCPTVKAENGLEVSASMGTANDCELSVSFRCGCTACLPSAFAAAAADEQD